MLEVWVQAGCQNMNSPVVCGAWYCPSLQRGGFAGFSKFSEVFEGMRSGCALAIIDAATQLDSSLHVHLPAFPPPRWLADSNCDYQCSYRALGAEYRQCLESWGHTVDTEELGRYAEELNAILIKEGATKCI